MSKTTKAATLDAEDMRRTFRLVQEGEISVSRAVEVLETWLHGHFNPNLLPASDECGQKLDDARIVELFQSAGVSFQRFVDVQGRERHWTDGSQEASFLIDGARTVLAAHDAVTALL